MPSGQIAKWPDCQVAVHTTQKATCAGGVTERDDANNLNTRPITPIPRPNGPQKGGGRGGASRARYFKKNGDVRPKAYVAGRVKALSNTLLDDGVGKLLADADGKMKPYKKADLNYDISCGWLVMEVDGKGMGATEGSCSVAEMLKELAGDARADSRSIMLASAWGHRLFTVGEAAESEQHAFGAVKLWS